MATALPHDVQNSCYSVYSYNLQTIFRPYMDGQKYFVTIKKTSFIHCDASELTIDPRRQK